MTKSMIKRSKKTVFRPNSIDQRPFVDDVDPASREPPSPSIAS